MDEKSEVSEILSKLKDCVLEDILDDDTLSILLVGSWADGTAKELSDIDLVVIKREQTSFIQNKKLEFQGKILDVWFHDAEYMLKAINKQIENLGDIYQASLYLSFLQNCKVWFERDHFIQNKIDLSKNWKWKPEHRLFVKMIGKPPKTSWAKKAYDENLELLSLYEYKFDNGLPISHRLKEYPELHPVIEESKVMELYDAIMFLYREQRIEREWTELLDAKKAIKEKNWSVAFVSLKDVLYFLLRRYTSPQSIELRDPSFWTFVEDKILLAELVKALEIAYL